MMWVSASQCCQWRRAEADCHMLDTTCPSQLQSAPMQDTDEAISLLAWGSSTFVKTCLRKGKMPVIKVRREEINKQNHMKINPVNNKVSEETVRVLSSMSQSRDSTAALLHSGANLYPVAHTGAGTYSSFTNVSRTVLT